MKTLLLSILIGIFLFTASPVSAHPGRTDANGGHTCRTNCAKWGLSDGEYHSHGAAPVQKVEAVTLPTKTPVKKTVDITTKKPVKKVTPAAKKKAIPTPKKIVKQSGFDFSRYSGDMDCPEFVSGTQAEAQAYFNSKGGSRTNNVDRLDADHDGLACENLR